MQDLIKYLGSIILTVMITTNADIVQVIKTHLKLDEKAKKKTLAGLWIQKLLNCNLCLGFWIGLIIFNPFQYSNSFYIALIISLSAETAGYYINKFYTKFMR